MPVTTLLAIAYLQSSDVDRLAENIEIAQHQFNLSHEKLEKTAAAIKALPHVLEEKFIKQKLLDSPIHRTIKFSVKPAYHNWPKPKNYQFYRDYTLSLDFANQMHLENVQRQLKEWMDNGYYIIQSEIVTLEKDNETLKFQKVRIVR